MKKKKILTAIIVIAVVAAITAGGLFAAKLMQNRREQYEFPLETLTLSEYVAGMEKVLKENFKTGDNLECTGVSIMLIEENGVLKVDDAFGVEFLEKETSRCFTSRASKNYETGKGSGRVWAYKDIEYSDTFENPLASKVLDALANIDFLALIKENCPEDECSSVRIDYSGERKYYSYDENGLRTFSERTKEEKEFHYPSYVYENGALERIYFSDEIDDSFILIDAGGDVSNINIYVPKTYEK